MIRAIFLDVGGVLLTNGWDRNLRNKCAETFDIEFVEMDERHRLVFDTFETGKLSFDEYLKRVVFYKERSFTLEEFKQFVFDQVQPHPEMIELIRQVKKEHQLKIGVVSNEGRELAVDRFRRFHFTDFVDFFIVSSFVHYRKPDPDIYNLAIDVVQIPASQIVYIDDRPLLVQVARGLGLNGIHHTDLETTKAALEQLLGG